MASVAEDRNIEKLTQNRSNLRRLFTKACNDIEALYQEPVKNCIQINIVYNKIVDKAERLFAVDAEINELYTVTEDQWDLIETYRDKFTEVKTVYESLAVNNEIASNASTMSADNLKLPKLNLKEFELVPRNWVAFWGQFHRIHEDQNLREEDKFQYLLSSLKPKTKARDIVESYPPSRDNYSKVIDHLKSRFGRDDLLIEVYIRDLLALVNGRINVKLTTLYDQLGSHLRALETLGVTTQNYAAMLYPVVESCLPEDILKAWDRYRLNRETETDARYPSKEKMLEELMTLLGNEVQGEEHHALAEAGFGSQNKSKKYIASQEQTAEVLVTTAEVLVTSTAVNKNNFSCIFCNRAHSSQDCKKAAVMTYEEKKSLVMGKRSCLVCLKIGHYAKTCHSNVKCLICQKRHYVILCPELQTKKKEFSCQEHTLAKTNATNLSAVHLPSEIIHLKTLMVRIRHRGQYRDIRALLDDGSHRSYIQKSLTKDLKLCSSGKEMLSQGLFGGKQTPQVDHNRYVITVESLENNFFCQIAVLDQPKICSTLPRVKDPSLLSELASRGIKLTDLGETMPPIQMLIGADVLGKILTGRIEVLTSGITAIETRLGWSVLGSLKRDNAVNMVTLCIQTAEIPELWKLETLGITDPVEKMSSKILEEDTMIHFQETVKVDNEQRYVVALPWLSGHPSLHDNYDIALARLHASTKRLVREGIIESYDKVFRQWEEEKIIETVPVKELTKTSHYLPHRPVIKLASETTKIRPVFDASVKQSGYASLNDCLSVGPNLLRHISSLLNKFRLGAIGAIADIKQAFLQIVVRPEDRDVLRFLWWEDKDHTKLKFYRHRRVVFGVTSSPFILNATINHHLNSKKFQLEELNKTLKTLKEGFHVDNLTTSVNSLEEFHQLKTQSCQIMNDGRFELRCWASNVAPKDEEAMVLGLKWNLISDELYCVSHSDFSNEKHITKRKILSVINSIYDPIGFVSPALLLPKLLLQEAWEKKINWYDELPVDLQRRYKRWEKTIHLLEKCAIPRRMFRGEYHLASLHVFTDASVCAYACCAFLRCQDESGISVHFVASKTRVAPIQRPTIPRLELLGATIGARLANTIQKTLDVPNMKTIYWTDSMVVLSWITKKEPWNTFVGNRVKEIRELTNIEDWRHVSGENNPADLPSRSCNWAELLQRKWWEGPTWLRQSEEFWPHSDITCPNEVFIERRKTIVTNVNIEVEDILQRFLYHLKNTSIKQKNRPLKKKQHIKATK